MIELLIAACLVTDLRTCKNVSLIFAVEGLTPVQCVMGSMPEVARWARASRLGTRALIQNSTILHLAA